MMAGRPPVKYPRRLRIYNPVLGILHVEGTPRQVAKWHIDNPPNVREQPWDARRQVMRPVSGTNGHRTWIPLYGIHASWWGRIICDVRMEVKRLDSEEVEAVRAGNAPAHKTRSRDAVRSNPVPTSTQHKEEPDMARTKSKSTRSKSKKGDAPDVDIDDDELEGLEEELEDIEEDDDEPDTVDEDDDEEDDDDDDLSSLSKRELKARAKDAGIKGYSKMSAEELVEALESEDEEDDEDEEEDEPAPKRKRSRAKGSTSKGSSKKSSNSKKSSSKKGGAKPGTRTSELGGVGVAELAEAAGVEPREARVFLRKTGVKKDKETGRYRWPSESNKDFKKLVKALGSDD